MDGFSTRPAKPARLELTGRVGAGADLRCVGPSDLGRSSAARRERRAPRLRGAAHEPVHPPAGGVGEATGRLTSKLGADQRGRADREDRHPAQPAPARPGCAQDEAQARIGLPFGTPHGADEGLGAGDITLSIPVGGRLGDPRFDFSEAIWSASHGGDQRDHAPRQRGSAASGSGADSRIERIEWIQYHSSRAPPPSPRQDRTQWRGSPRSWSSCPTVRLALTPVVSSRDVAALRSMHGGSALDRVAREGRLARDPARGRLFAQRFPGRAVPTRPRPPGAALAGTRGPSRPRAVPELGAGGRLAALRAGRSSARASTGPDCPERAIGPASETGTAGSQRSTCSRRRPQRPSKARGILRRLGVPPRPSRKGGRTPDARRRVTLARARDASPGGSRRLRHRRSPRGHAHRGRDQGATRRPADRAT